MLVLHIITGLNAGGAEQSLFNLIQGGLKTHCQNVVVSLTGGGKYESLLGEEGVPVHSLGMKRGWPSLNALLRLKKIIKMHKPDLIQGWMYHGNLLSELARFLGYANSPVVWTVRQCLYDIKDEKKLTQLVILITRLLSKRVSSIIFNSSLSKMQHEGIGFSSLNSVVIPNGFDTKKYGNDVSIGLSVRSQLSITDNEFVVGHVGRYHPMKDHACFVNAAVIALAADPELKFMLVGTDVSYENEQLLKLIPKLLRERFLFLGERSDVHKLYCAMDAFCLSSSSEAFPNVLGEAMASELPCITTNVGDASFLLDETGVIVPPKNSETLANAMLEVRSLSCEQRKALGAAARKRIEDKFGLGGVINQYATLYNSINRSHVNQNPADNRNQ